MMKLVLNAPIQQDKIAALLDGYREGENTIQVMSRTGIQMCLECDGPCDVDEAAALVKKIIRSTDFGKVLTFSVTPG